jgi:CDP-paratose 2-epimerase
MKILITGAGGLIGSEAVEYYCSQGHEIYGIENNQRQIFFGEKGSTLSRLNQLKEKQMVYQP